MVIEVRYLPYLGGASDMPYPPELDSIRRGVFPQHDVIEVFPDGKQLLIAMNGSQAAGYALVDLPSKYDLGDEPALAYVPELVVDARHRRARIGTELLTRVGRLVDEEYSHCDLVGLRPLRGDSLEPLVNWYSEFGFVEGMHGLVAPARRVAEGPRRS